MSRSTNDSHADLIKDASLNLTEIWHISETK